MSVIVVSTGSSAIAVMYLHLLVEHLLLHYLLHILHDSPNNDGNTMLTAIKFIAMAIPCSMKRDAIPSLTGVSESNTFSVVSSWKSSSEEIFDSVIAPLFILLSLKLAGTLIFLQPSLECCYPIPCVDWSQPILMFCWCAHLVYFVELCQFPEITLCQGQYFKLLHKPWCKNPLC